MSVRLLGFVAAIAACRSPTRHSAPPPSNEQRDTAPVPVITNLRVMIIPLFPTCPANNPVEVTIDGVTATLDYPCEPTKYVIRPDGTKVIVLDSGLSAHEMPPVKLGPGRHRVRVRHVPSNVVGETEIVLPQRSPVGPSWPKDREAPLMELLPVRVADTYEERESRPASGSWT